MPTPAGAGTVRQQANLRQPGSKVAKRPRISVPPGRPWLGRRYGYEPLVPAQMLETVEITEAPRCNTMARSSHVRLPYAAHGNRDWRQIA